MLKKSQIDLREVFSFNEYPDKRIYLLRKQGKD